MMIHENSVRAELNNLTLARRMIGVIIFCLAIQPILFDTVSQQIRIFAAILACISSIIVVSVVRNNVILFSVSLIIAYANYSACYENTFPARQSLYTNYLNSNLSIEAMLLISVFNGVLILLMPKVINKYNYKIGSSRIAEHKLSKNIVWFCIVVLIIIFFLCSSGFSETGGRATNNSIFEYAYIVFILAFFCAGQNQYLHVPIAIIAVIYMLQGFLGGNRASVLAIAILIFIIYFAKRLNWITVLPYLLSGILLLISIGYFRYTSGLAILKLPQAIMMSSHDGFSWDTAYAAFHEGVTFLQLKSDISLLERQRLFFQWIGSWFFGARIFPDGNLAAFCVKRYSVMGGGFLPCHLYFYLGIPGVIIGALWVAFWYSNVNRISNLKNERLVFQTICCVVTFCRWYLYSPSPLTTGLWLSLIIYASVNFVLKQIDR